MKIAHEKLDGLDRDKVLAALLPILSAHGVDAVEVLWQTDGAGRVLKLTVEQPGSQSPGAGVSVDLCSELSRDLSAALDVADCIEQRYRLEVGSPGLERALYRAEDYQRFSGRAARIKLREPEMGQAVFHGVLEGLDPEGRVLLRTDEGKLAILELSRIDAARLVFRMAGASRQGPSRAPGGRSRKKRDKAGRAGTAR